MKFSNLFLGRDARRDAALLFTEADRKQRRSEPVVELHLALERPVALPRRARHRRALPRQDQQVDDPRHKTTRLDARRLEAD